MRLGAVLKRARRERGLTLAEVEQRTDGAVRAAAVSAYERGIRPLPPERLTMLCEVYGISADDALDSLRVEVPRGTSPVVDVAALERADDLAPLQRTVARIVAARGGLTGSRVGIRSGDIEVFAHRGTANLDSLRARGVLVDPGDRPA